LPIRFVANHATHDGDLTAAQKLGQEEAKAQALAVLRGLRYGNEEYFWVNTIEPRMVMHPFKQAEEALLKRKKELERFEKLVVGRKLRMVELKKRIAQLEDKRKTSKGGSHES
jgi:Single Cache domain 2